MFEKTCKMTARIIPDVWMLGRGSIRMAGPCVENKAGDLRVFVCEPPDTSKPTKRLA
jgi:hypothetical protein